MMLRNACLGAILVIAPSIARAGPIKDPAAWTQSFVQAALKNDGDGMGALVEEAAAPGFNVTAVKAAIQAAAKWQVPPQIDSAEAFGEKDLGSFYKRFNVAVVYKKGFYFYSVVMGRTGAGWMIYGFKADRDVNEILNDTWPH